MYMRICCTVCSIIAAMATAIVIGIVYLGGAHAIQAIGISVHALARALAGCDTLFAPTSASFSLITLLFPYSSIHLLPRWCPTSSTFCDFLNIPVPATFCRGGF